MTLSRRRLLACAPLAAGLVALAGCRSQSVIDVRAYGATGDGVTDDSQAIQSAAAALRSEATLYFPPGRYRFAQHRPPGMAAVVVTGVSNVTVEFAPGAELLMDNIDVGTRTGTSHAIVVRGPASRIELRNITIRWSGNPRRSLGDGIRVEGMPDSGPAGGWAGPRRPVSGISLRDCLIENSPQTGVVMLGASNIAITGLRVVGSGADGVHFNACRYARIRDVHTSHTGDDGLALVTYFDREHSYNHSEGTFAFPALTRWSNSDFDITDVTVQGGRANGVRLAGAQQVRISGLDVAGLRAGSAVMVDSAGPGADVGWHYVASRDIHIADVSVRSCNTGIHVLARPGESGEPRFTDFGVHIGESRVDSCENWAVHVESIAAQSVQGLHVEHCRITSHSSSGGNGGLGVTRAGNVSFGEVTIRHTEPVVAFRACEAYKLAVDKLAVSIDNSKSPTGVAPACVALDGSGLIGNMELGWPGAPPSWDALEVSSGDHPVVINHLKVHTGER